MHELPHNHSRNPKHAHPLPTVDPYINTCNNSGSFPNILSTMEIFSSRFFSFNLLDQVLLLHIYNTPKSKSKPHFVNPFSSVQSFSFFFNHITTPCFNFLHLPQNLIPHFIFLPPQNPLANLLLKI
jgi:hypothetical protein